MAEVLTGNNYVSRERTVAGREKTLHRVLIVVIVVLAAALIGEVVYHLVIVPKMAVTSITIRSELDLSDDEVLALAGIEVGTLYFQLDAGAIEKAIEAYPAVRSAHVERRFPNAVTIDVRARTPLAVALAETADGSVPLVFDDEGVVFGIGDHVRSNDLPVVSGLRFSSVAEGMTLPSLVVDFLADLREFRLEAPELFTLFSEYRIVRKNDYAYEVVVYPMHYELPVRIGTTINAEMIQYVLMVLEYLRRDGQIPSLAELDFRNGEGVLISREGVDG